jgi:hypothetical protein
MPRDGRKGLHYFHLVVWMCDFILVFHELSKGYPGSQIIVPENRKLKDEYGEFVSIAGFWPFRRVLLLRY